VCGHQMIKKYICGRLGMAQPGHTQGHDWQHKSLILPDRVREETRERPVSLRGDQI